MTGWAICGEHNGRNTTKGDKDTQEEEREEREEDLVQETSAATKQAEDKGLIPNHVLTREARVLLGHMCKRLIDTGRTRWLSSQGLQGELIRFVPESVSPENRLLLGYLSRRD
mmetsp:Transcript_3989/g.5311  ORF Transcript_3989/g.5311 Transcript_3989/m.5311 type:complete len:113 (+) Transcript_3989:1603-1941(+)